MKESTPEEDPMWTGALRRCALDGVGLEDPVEHGCRDACWAVTCADLKLTESTGAENTGFSNVLFVWPIFTGYCFGSDFVLFTGNAEVDKKGKAPVLSEMTSDTFVSRDTEEINIVTRMVGNASVTTQERGTIEDN